MHVGELAGAAALATQIGAGTLTVDGQLQIGNLGTGDVVVDDGTTLTVAGAMRLGYLGGSGTLTLSGGAASCSEIQRGTTSSTLRLNSGTFTVGNKIFQAGIVRVGDGTTSTSSFTIPADYQLNASSLYVASDANATLSQYGSATLSNAYIGDNKTGTWQIRSGATANVSGSAYAGYWNPGTVSVNGTLNTATLYSGYGTTGGFFSVAIGGRRHRDRNGLCRLRRRLFRHDLSPGWIAQFRRHHQRQRLRRPLRNGHRAALRRLAHRHRHNVPGPVCRQQR